MAVGTSLVVLGLIGPGAFAALGQEGSESGEPVGSVVEARLEATIPVILGSVPVRMEFLVEPSPSATSMPVTLLQMDPARVSPLQVSVDTDAVQVTMREERDRFFVGEISLPVSRAPRKPILVALEYAVLPSWDQEGTTILPLVAPGWAPADPGPRSFTASVRIPAGMRVVSTFPTSVISRPPGDRGGEIVIALQAVPSVLIFRTAQAGAPSLTLERALDGVVVAALLVMVVLGLRFVRSRA